MADVSPHKMVSMVVLVFLIGVLGAAFTPTLQTQVDAWSASLTAANQTGAATIVSLIPTIFWILLAVGVILMSVGAFLGKGKGL